MDGVWARLEDELSRRGKGPQWLADQLGAKIQRIQNWKTRGVPSAALPEIAAVLGWSVDRLLGTTTDRAPSAPSQQEADLLRLFHQLPSAVRARVIAYTEGLLAGAPPAAGGASGEAAPNIVRLPDRDRRGSGYRQITSPWTAKRHPQRRHDDTKKKGGK